MANINISDLRHAGADLFLDSESYLNDLTEGEMTNTFGAFSCPCSSWFCRIRWRQGLPGVQQSEDMGILVLVQVQNYVN